MKIVYAATLALSVCAVASCKKDDDGTPTPANPNPNDTTLNQKDTAETARLEMQDWLTAGPWNVDTFSIRVWEDTTLVADSIYSDYGRWAFAAGLPASPGRLASQARWLIHTHPNLSGQMVTDSLGYWLGNAETGVANRRYLSVWGPASGGNSARIYTIGEGGRYRMRFENRVTMHTGSGKTQIWERVIRISR